VVYGAGLDVFDDIYLTLAGIRAPGHPAPSLMPILTGLSWFVY